MGTTETKTVKQLPVRMPADIYNALKGLSFFTDISMNEHIIRALRAYLTDEGRRELVDVSVERFRKEHQVVLDKLADL